MERSLVRRPANPGRRATSFALRCASRLGDKCAQLDWGSYGSIDVGSTRRRLSFFVMVLCDSRLMYLEFTVSQTMEFFLACHEHAFASFRWSPFSPDDRQP